MREFVMYLYVFVLFLALGRALGLLPTPYASERLPFVYVAI